MDWWDDPSIWGNAGAKTGSVTVKLPPARPADKATNAKYKGKSPNPEGFPKVTKADVQQQQAIDADSAESAIGHWVDAISDAATRGLAAIPGMVGDIVVQNNPIAETRRILQKQPPAPFHLPGMGPVSQGINEAIGAPPPSRSRAENYARAAVSGAAALPTGPEGIVVGAASGIGSQAGAEVTPDSEWGPFIGGTLGGGIGAAAHGYVASRPVRLGYDHPNYEPIRTAILKAEGGGTIENPNTSPKGARGPMQVMPATAKNPGLGVKPWNGKTEADLVRVGNDYTAALTHKYNGDEVKVMAAYNAGYGKVDSLVRRFGDKWWEHLPDETKGYLNRGLPTYDMAVRSKGVPPIAPEEIARVMNDPEAAGGEPLPIEDTRAPIEAPDNVVPIEEARARKDYIQASGAIDELHDKVTDLNYKVTELGHTADIDRLEQTRGQVNSELQHYDPTSPEFAKLEDIDNMLKESIAHQGGKPRLYEPEASDKFMANPREVEPVNDTSAQDALDREGVYGFPQTEEQTPPAGPTPPEGRTLGQFIKDLWNDESGSYRDNPMGGEEPHPGPVQKLISALSEATPIRQKQEKIYSQERARRLAESAQVAQYTSGEKGFHAELGKLAGEMPQADYASVRHRFSQDEIDQLYDMVKDNPRLTQYDKINARTALGKLLGAEGVKVPTKSEIKLLSNIFPKEMIDGLMKNRPFAERFWEATANALNIPRSLMASFDLSAPFRQGVFMVGRKEFWKNFLGMFKQFGSEKAFQAVQDEIASRPTFPLMQKAKLALTGADRFLTDREEAFMSDWAEKIPVAGKGVRASTRAYVGFLNRLRADVFDDLVHQMKQTDPDFAINNPKALKDIARFVNAATGRGSLGKFNQAAPFLSAVFFSPRLMASRLQMLNPAFYITLNPIVRKAALKSLLSFSAIALTTLGLAKMGGMDVEPDPRSADFAKARIRDTRFDVLGGFQQYIRLGAQIITGQKKSSSTGKIKDFGDPKEYKAETRLDALLNFGIAKESPIASLATDLLRGKDMVGRPITTQQAIADRFIPLLAQDMQDAMKEYGPQGAAVAVPGAFGIGVQTYQPIKKKAKAKDPFKNDFSDFGNDFSKASKADMEAWFKE